MCAFYEMIEKRRMKKKLQHFLYEANGKIVYEKALQRKTFKIKYLEFSI